MTQKSIPSEVIERAAEYCGVTRLMMQSALLAALGDKFEISLVKSSTAEPRRQARPRS